MNDRGRRAIRWGGALFVAHAGVVLALSAVHNLLWGKVAFAWEAWRLLRLVDLPVYWVIERAASRVTYLPPGLAFLGVHWTGLLLEGALHVVIGGVFYGLLAGAVALVSYRRRPL